ncbi:MAG: SPFH domain-containing protein, partial [Ruminococcus sp.]
MPVSKHKHKKKQYQPQRGEKMYPESEIRRRVTEALDDYVTHCDGLMLLSLHDTLGLGVKRLEPVYAKMIEYFFNFRNAYVTMDGTYTVGDRTINIKGDNKTDMSMQIASQEGKNIDADIYISVRPTDIEKIIKSFGTKSFDAIVNNDIYGLTKGKLSSVSQAYSVYDIQSSRVEIQAEVFQILSETLADTYAVELVRLEIGT